MRRRLKEIRKACFCSIKPDPKFAKSQWLGRLQIFFFDWAGIPSCEPRDTALRADAGAAEGTMRLARQTYQLAKACWPLGTGVVRSPAVLPAYGLLLRFGAKAVFARAHGCVLRQKYRPYAATMAPCKTMRIFFRCGASNTPRPFSVFLSQSGKRSMRYWHSPLHSQTKFALIFLRQVVFFRDT